MAGFYGRIHWFDGHTTWIPIPKRSEGGGGEDTVESVIAYHPTTQGAIRRGGAAVTARARGALTAARLNNSGFDSKGRVSIDGEHKAPDYRVHLSVNGPGGGTIAAALSVEYGHIGAGYGPRPFQMIDAGGKGHEYKGKFILHKAIGKTPRKGVR